MLTRTHQLLEDMRDIHKQATVERSHHYVGRTLERAIAEIERYDRNLKTRDDFIGAKGLWAEFVDTLPRS